MDSGAVHASHRLNVCLRCPLPERLQLTAFSSWTTWSLVSFLEQLQTLASIDWTFAGHLSSQISKCRLRTELGVSRALACEVCASFSFSPGCCHDIVGTEMYVIKSWEPSLLPLVPFLYHNLYLPETTGSFDVNIALHVEMFVFTTKDFKA